MNFENETEKNDLVKTEELPIAQPQVNEPADEHCDDLFLSSLNKDFCFQPASEFDNFYYFDTDPDMPFHD